MNVLVNSMLTTATTRSVAQKPSAGIGRMVLAAMQQWGRARAIGELERLARCYQPAHPELARQFVVAARSNREALH